MVDYILNTSVPLYSAAQAVTKFLDKKSALEIIGPDGILGQIQSYLESSPNADWTDPDEWLEERFTGRTQELVKELWEGGQGMANPRHIFRSIVFAHSHGLIQRHKTYSITELGNAFVQGDDAVIKTADSREGLQFLLDKIKEHQPCEKTNIREQWINFVRDNNSKFIKQNHLESSLVYRLSNLLQRELLRRRGTAFVATEEGNQYLYSIGKYRGTEKDKILEQVENLKEAINEKILTNIREIEPENFKRFVVDLLTRMKFEDAEVTGYLKDGEIDITAKKVNGLSEINYVFEVKRQKDDIQKSAVNEFAGAMGAINKADVGVFISTSKFSDEAKKAAEDQRKNNRKIIVLIDEEGLVELIKEHKIGIEKTTIELYDIDSSYFQQEFGEDSGTQSLEP